MSRDFVSGWNGRTCEHEIDQCDSRPCKNGGVCINRQTTYSCACLFGIKRFFFFYLRTVSGDLYNVDAPARFIFLRIFYFALRVLLNSALVTPPMARIRYNVPVKSSTVQWLYTYLALQFEMSGNVQITLSRRGDNKCERVEIAIFEI